MLSFLAVSMQVIDVALVALHREHYALYMQLIEGGTMSVVACRNVYIDFTYQIVLFYWLCVNVFFGALSPPPTLPFVQHLQHPLTNLKSGLVT